MPFTISHAAAALPFRRTRLVFSAIVVGCMAPDFEYFLHARIISRVSHTLVGAFEFSLPAALVVLTLFYWVMEKPLLALMPASIQRRVDPRPFTLSPWKRFLLIISSLMIGIACHLLWDSFTHPGMWAVDHIDWFYRSHRVIGHRIPNYEIAQHLSTLLGLALLTVSVVHWYRTTPEHGTTIPALQPSTRWKIGALILLSAALFGFLRAKAVIGPYYFTVGFLANAVVAFVSFTLLELLLFSLLIRSRMRDLEPQDA